MEIFGWRRRVGCPLEAGGRPGVLSGNFALVVGQGEVNHVQQGAERENRGARMGEHVEHLKFGRIAVIAARHTEIAKNELREEGQVEAYEQGDRGDARQNFRIELAGNLGPPEVNAADVTHNSAADHDVVEVCNDEVGVVDVNVQAQGGEEQAREPANGEQPDKAKSVKHWRIPGN